MVSLAFHLFQCRWHSYFCFAAFLTVVVHSFVADSSLLDYCDLVGLLLLLLLLLLFCFCFFSTLCLQVGIRLGF